MNIIVILISVLVILFISYYNFVDVTDSKNNSFVEPQHRLITLLSNISRADKVVLKDVKERFINNSNYIYTRLLGPFKSASKGGIMLSLLFFPVVTAPPNAVEPIATL